MDTVPRALPQCIYVFSRVCFVSELHFMLVLMLIAATCGVSLQDYGQLKHNIMAY